GTARRDEPLGGSDEGGDRALHVDRTAAAQHAVAQCRAERVERPLLGGAGRHDIGVPGETQIRAAAAPARVKVRDRLVTLLGEGQRVTGEAEVFEPRRDDAERAFVLRRYARAADQLGGERYRIDRPIMPGGGGRLLAHSRRRSLIEVLARVCASTCLTMTAQ